MKKNLLLAAAMLCGLTASAQTYQPLDIYQGFDADVFATQTPFDDEPQFVKGVDNDKVGFYTHTFFNKVKDFKGIDPDALPLVGPSGSQYSMDVKSLNALSLCGQQVNEADANRAPRTEEGTLKLATPVSTDELYFLACAGNGPAGVEVTLNYTDGTSDPTQVSVLDWWDKGGEPNCVLAGLDRADRSNNNTDQGGHVTLLEYAAYGDASKQIESVTFKMTDANDKRVVTILALSANGESLAVSEGLTDDVIAEAMPLDQTTTIGVDRNSWILVMKGIDFSAQKVYTYGVPDDRKLTTKANANGEFGDIPFVLAPYDQLNATRLTADDPETEDVDESCDTLLFAGRPQGEEIYLLGTAGNGPANIKVTYLYDDNTTVEEGTWEILDWCNKQSDQNYTSGRYDYRCDDRDYCGFYVYQGFPDNKPLLGVILKNTAATGNSKGVVVAATINGSFTSGINNVETVKKANNVFYNVAGQRVGQSYKGIVIRNGKKYIK